MAYQNNGYNPVLSQQMYGDARGRETVPQGQAQPMQHLQHMPHMQQQQFYPSPYAYIKPQQSQTQAQAHPQLQAQPLQYGGGGGTMAPPPNMAAMSGGMMPAAMSHQQMHMRNTSNQQTPPRNPPAPISATPPTSQQFQRPPGPSPPLQKPPYPSPGPGPSPALQPPMPVPAPTQQNLSSTQAPSQLMQQPQKQILQPPLSPTSAHRESQRVTALLEINRALLQEVVLLQNAGKAGVPPQPPSSPAATDENADIKDVANQAQPQAAKTPCREYIECMRRLQANLAFLVLIADRSHKLPSAIPPTPVIMEAPPAPPTGSSNWSADGIHTLERMYKNLKELYPEWKGGGSAAEKAA